MIVRISKIALTASLAALALLVGFDNILDYGTNFAFVQHVLSMDTTFPGNKLMWRAITNDWVHHVAYWGIIATEIFVGILCAAGAWRLFQARALPASEFRLAKDIAIAGLAAGFGLYFVGFLVVGGEWFQMWQSGTWNGQQGAFRFAVSFAVVLIFVAMEDHDL